MKQHSAQDIESIVISIDPKRFPKFFANKVKDMVDSGLSQEEAEKEAAIFMRAVELEIYFEVGQGAFAVEIEPLDCGARLFSPFSKEELEESEEDDVLR